jgi:putative DNA primase/helicase
VPPEIARRFVRVGREFYFPDGTRAFSDRGRRLTTRSENTEVIRSLIDIARARGWQSLVVSGTERFRKEAWLAAHAAGIEARGYQPTEFEQARAVRARARAQSPDSSRESAAPPAEKRRSSLPAERMRERAARRGWIKGRLLEHGPANYRHDPSEPQSYFVKVETARGERTVWGVDLERALKQALSRPQVGDRIALRAVRREPVTVRAPALNRRGEVVGTQPVDKHRNRWIVEQQQFLKLRAEAASVLANPKIDAREGARQHPELLGSYLQLQSAKALAAERIRDREDQAVFVERIRRVLAHSIARGEPLAPLRLREARSQPVVPQPTRRPAERDASLVR